MQVLPKLFKLIPWVDLDTFYAKVKFGDIGFSMGKSENYFFFFGNCSSLRSQSCLKHSTQWVNEVERVSKVKVILWPWSKVTQISKLNVWLLASIFRWAIQGLLALLFWSVRGYGNLKCQGKIRERSGNFEVDDKWQPWNFCIKLFSFNVQHLWLSEDSFWDLRLSTIECPAYLVMLPSVHRIVQ